MPDNIFNFELPGAAEKKVSYDEYCKIKFFTSPVLNTAEKIFIQREGKLNLGEFKNIVLNVYELAKLEAIE
ncbi:hypothetical protein FACS189447_07740 [Spirochaetia bacterium]|nr:hypothetical protein FACS189447_07740 [Spirochaetia bacterium]